MKVTKFIRTFALIYSLLITVTAQPVNVWSQQSSGPSTVSTPQANKEIDNQHGFDFNFGTWKTHIKRLQTPLTGSQIWTESNGTVAVRKVWDGRANLEEIEVDGPSGHIEGVTLRLYNPQSHQWNLYFSNSKSGTLGPPMVGEFKNGRGEFFDQEEFNGKSIMVRQVFSDWTSNSYHFEQAFSADGGKTWEPNWIADLTRSTGAQDAGSQSAADRQPDFDWELGTWKIHISRLQHPLTGASTGWTELNGTVVCRPFWNGKGNLAEIEAEGPSGHLQFLSLRLYNPRSKQWSLNFASVGSGALSQPMFGGFGEGRGEFYDQEPFNGRMIMVKFAFSSASAGSGRSEQSFSDDGGKTWETNWINQYTSIKE